MNRSSIYNGIPFKPGILSSISRSKLWTPSVKSPIKLDLLASHEKLVWNFGNQVPLPLWELKIYESNGNGTFAGSKTEPTLALNDYVWAAVAFKSFQKRITALKSQHRSSLKEKNKFFFCFLNECLVSVDNGNIFWWKVSLNWSILAFFEAEQKPLRRN